MGTNLVVSNGSGRVVYGTVLRRRISKGLVDGKAFSVDASLIEPKTNRERRAPCDPGLTPERRAEPSTGT